MKVKSIVKSCQKFDGTENIAKDHKKRIVTIKIIRRPPPNGVPTFHALNLSKRGVGLLNISTVC